MNKIMRRKTQEQGFTLIEILVVIGIIAVLAAIVLVAINPARQFALARDTQRVSNTTAILDAAGQYLADNQGVIAGLEIPGGDVDQAFCGHIVPTYLPALPTDPASDPHNGADIECADLADGDSLYTVEILDENTGRITVCSTELEPTLERDEPICITR